jgi:hypothetical protein
MHKLDGNVYQSLLGEFYVISVEAGFVSNAFWA